MIFDWLGADRKRREEEERRARAVELEHEEWDARRRQWASKIERAILNVETVAPDASDSFRIIDRDWAEGRISEDLLIDARDYIAEKPNQNVLVCGASGEGKSVLMRHLLRRVESPRVILSFKPNDEYLKLGYPIADVIRAIPNPFQDLNSFITAFTITFPLDVIGVVASQVPALLFNLASECEDWKDFLGRLEKRVRHPKDRVQLTALHFIDEHVRLLVYESRIDADSLLSSVVRGETNVVFDFEGLNESAKVFYSELLLNQLWTRLQSGGGKGEHVIVCVDEAYRLTRGTFQRYHSVLYEMARDIRLAGALWTSTQDYTDMEDDIRNQFETQFVFKTTAKADLDALRAIDPMMSWTASVLPSHTFFDAKAVDHQRVDVLHYFARVPVFEPDKTRWVQEPDEAARYITDADQSVDLLVATRMIRSTLTNGVIYANQFARVLMERYRVGENEAKLLINDALRPLVEGGEVRRMEFEREDGQSVILYYKLPEDTAGASILHGFLATHLKGYLEQKGIKILRTANIGDRLSDVETDDMLYEIETGLKKGKIGDLQDRIAKAQKRVFVLVPNSAIKERYAKLASERVVVGTMRDLALSIQPSVRG
jgi:Cdc6-like AAA superfamily ATPase